jgi:transcriptional regulator with XRE-family HTH domain
VVEWQSRGGLLRWWRTEVAHLSQRALAERLGVARTAVTNWEHDVRLASIDIERIDSAMGGDGALADLLWAFGTPEGLEPGRVWTNVFRGPSCPVWMWIRGATGRVRVDAEWGLYAFATELDLPPNGLFVTVGASIDDSPVSVILSEPGWIDFGRGELPLEIPGAVVVDAVEVMRPSSANREVFNDLLSANLAALFERSPREVRGLGERALRPVASFLDELAKPETSSRPWPPLPEGIDELDRTRFARLREARKLSLAETAGRLRSMTGASVGKDTLRRFESGKGEPHDPLLPARLDHVLGGNGHLAVMAVLSSERPGSVTFPGFWDAPIWLEFEWVGPERDDDPGGSRSVAELLWGGWRRTVDGDLPLLVICHGSPRALRVDTAPGVRWTAGIGRRLGATPINHAWVPTSVDTTQQAIEDYQGVLIDAMKNKRDHRSR